MKLLSVITACLLTFTVAQRVSCQTKEDSLRQQHIALNEIEVNAPVSILSPQQWPGSISILDSLSLENGNSYLIASHLNSLPGVLMQQGTLSTNRITIRGVGSRTPYNSNRIKAYWGAIPLTDGDGVTSIEDLGLNDVNSLAILKGPSSALYGAGLGGVILINLWEATSIPQGLIFKTEAGRYGTYSNQLTTAIKSNSGISTITASQLHTDGYRDNSCYNRYNLTLKGKYQVGRHYWHYLYNYRYLYGQIPSSLDSIDFQNNPQKAADSWAAIKGYEKSNRHLLNTGIQASLSPQITNSFDIFGSISNLNELRPFNRIKDAKQSFGFREKLSFQTSSIKVEGGAEAMLESSEVQLFGVKEDNLDQQLNQTRLLRSYINLFGLLEYKVHPKLLLQAAFNLNTTHYQSQQTDASQNTVKHRYPLTFSPHLGINYQLSQVANLYASAGHGFSTPSLEEAQLPDGTFNPSIKPEQGYQFDVGYRFLSLNQNTRLELTAYWMRMTNLLVTKRESEDLFYGTNAGRTSHQGIELSVNHRIPLTNSNELKFSGAFDHSVNQFEEFIDDGNNYNNKHLPGIPAYNIYLTATANINKVSVHVNYRMNGKQYLNDSNVNTYEAFDLVNAKASWTFNMKHFKYQVFIGANNILNRHYASMVLVNAPTFGNNLPRYYYPGQPFNLYLGLSLMI